MNILTLLFTRWPKILLNTEVATLLIPFIILSDMDRTVHRSVVQLSENLGLIELGIKRKLAIL